MTKWPPMPEWFKGKKWTDCTPDEQQQFRDYIRELHKAMRQDTRTEDAVIAAAARKQR